MSPPADQRGPLRLLLLDSIRKWGGGQKWCVETGRALAARGHRVVVACEAGSPLEQRADEGGLETWPARLRGPAGLFTARKLGRFLEAQRIDLCIANVGRDVFVGALACRGRRTRLLQRRGLVRPVKRGPISRWLYGRAVARVIVNSLAIRDVMLDGARFLSADRFALIPNGVAPAAFQREDGTAIRHELGIDAAAPVVATVGRLAAMKGHADLLRGWALVLRDLPQSVLLVVGEGEEEQALRRQAAGLSPPEAVRFLGFRRDARAVLSAADVLALTSVRDEGCSNALLEGMALALPAVVTRCGGLPYVVEEGRTGLVVPTGDAGAIAGALLRLLRDPAARSAMGTAARQLAESRYNLDAVTSLLEDLLQSLRP